MAPLRVGAYLPAPNLYPYGGAGAGATAKALSEAMAAETAAAEAAAAAAAADAAAASVADRVEMAVEVLEHAKGLGLWFSDDKVLVKIEPWSDAVGKLEVGDKLLALDGSPCAGEP